MKVTALGLPPRSIDSSAIRALTLSQPPPIRIVASMEGEPIPDSPSRPNLRLQATGFPGFAVPSLLPSFKLDEGYSDETRSQSEKDIVSDNVIMLPEWVLAQSEVDRAG